MLIHGAMTTRISRFGCRFLNQPLVREKGEEVSFSLPVVLLDFTCAPKLETHRSRSRMTIEMRPLSVSQPHWDEFGLLLVSRAVNGVRVS